MALDPAHNSAFGILGVATDASQTTFTFEDATLLPVPATTADEYNMPTFNPALQHTGLDTNFEIVRVTGGSGNDRTVTRAQEGTTGKAHAAGDMCFNSFTKKMRDDILALYRQTIPGWFRENVPGTQGPTILDREVGTTAGLFDQVLMVRSGSITGMVAGVNGTITGGTIVIESYIGGVATGFTMTLNSSNQFIVATQAFGLDTFVAKNSADLRFTSSSLTPTTLELIASLEIETTT